MEVLIFVAICLIINKIQELQIKLYIKANKVPKSQMKLKFEKTKGTKKNGNLTSGDCHFKYRNLFKKFKILSCA